MLSTLSTRRALLAIFLATTATLAAGCDDDPTEPGEAEPEFNRVEFTLVSGATTRVDTVTTTGTQTGTRTFPAGTTSISITNTRFLKPDGTVDPIVTPASFELRQGTGGTTGVTFTLTQGESFKGTIAGLTGPGERSIVMVLWHKADQHEDFAQPLRLTIQ